jgi:hypothetical protein
MPPIASSWVAPTVIAHNVEIAGEVAGLWHIEPNHDPTAGIPSRVWVALSQRGGQALPLDQLQCQLTIVQQGAKPGTQSNNPPSPPPIVLEPKPLNDPSQPSALGSMVSFPRTGAYELRLACKPQPGSSIAAFVMNYEVTVARSVAPIASPIASPSPIGSTEAIAPQLPSPRSLPSIPGAIWLPLALLGTIGLVLWSKLPR